MSNNLQYKSKSFEDIIKKETNYLLIPNKK